MTLPFRIRHGAASKNDNSIKNFGVENSGMGVGIYHGAMARPNPERVYPPTARLTLVADPDALLSDKTVLQELRERGFELLPFEDRVAFRYAYESKYRSGWDRGEQIELIVVFRAPATDFTTLPFDLIESGRKVSLNLADLFPNLSYSVVAALELADLEPLYKAQARHQLATLGDNATKDFVLRHVYNIVPDQIEGTVGLLRLLLRRHYRGQRVPPLLEERILQIFRQEGRLADWPLAQILPNRDSFFAFLQERWPLFLDRLAFRTSASSSPLQFPGPVDLPWEHEDIRIYIDSLFLSGFLRPVTHPHSEVLIGHWVAIGVQSDPIADRLRRLERLLNVVEQELPAQDAFHPPWQEFAQQWAELTVSRFQADLTNFPPIERRLLSLRDRVAEAFRPGWKNAIRACTISPPYRRSWSTMCPGLLHDSWGSPAMKRSPWSS